MRTIWYMGAKTRLTDAIEQAIERAAPRAESVLDLMSGTAVVARALAPRYRVVANDVQAYAAAIAAGYLLPSARELAELTQLDPERDLGAAFRENQRALLAALAPAVALEDAYLRAYGLTPDDSDPGDPLDGAFGAGDPDPAQDPSSIAAAERRVPRDAGERARGYRAFALQETPAFCEARDVRAGGLFAGARDLFARATIQARRADPKRFPYLLASSYYPNVYLGLRQAVAVDSLRYAIDRLRGPGAEAKARHYLAALLHATSVTTSATSHFCQPRGLVRESEVRAVLKRRAISIPSRTLAFAREIALAARASQRAGRGAGRRSGPAHAVRRSDWRALYARWDEVQADVVYADPPYTADNYSRFYHVLEVLTRYDYPELQVQRGKTTKGRYPTIERRHRSPFCVKSQVEREIGDLFAETAARGAALVFSYGEENGLLLRAYRDQGDGPAAALRRLTALAEAHYRDVSLEKKPLLHSGQGDSNLVVTELLLVARGPRRTSGKPGGKPGGKPSGKRGGGTCA